MEQNSFLPKEKDANGSNSDLPVIRSLSSCSLSTNCSSHDGDKRNKQQTWLRLVLAWLWRKHEKKRGNKTQEEVQEEKNRSRRYLALTAMITTLVAIWWHRTRRKRGILQTIVLQMLGDTSDNSYCHAKETPLSLLWKAAKNGHVKRALLMGSQSAIAYQDRDGTWRRTTLPSQSPSLQTSLLETLAQGGCTNVSALPESIWSKLATPTIAALPFVYLALLYKMMKNLHSGANDGARTYDGEASERVTFQDIAGLDQVVTEVAEIVSYLESPVRYRNLGARPPRGILLHGPPGSGKTLLARAMAGEARCEAFVACSGSDFVESYVGRGSARIRNLFDQARAQAYLVNNTWYSRLFASPNPRHRPASAVIFMDEIDALARSRSVFGGGGNEERDQTLNQLLTELDGFASSPEVTFIFIGATNRPDVLDPAILRRFDRRVYVGYPDSAGRKAILEIHAKRIRHGRLDYEYLACDAITKAFSGADLRNVVNDAALLAVRDKSPLVEQRHVLHAIRRVHQMKHSPDHSGMDDILRRLPTE